MSKNTFTKQIVRGVIGGLAGTIIMDLVIVGIFAVAGMPIDLIYSFIGEVAGTFFLRVGINLPGSILLGALMHFFLGLALGGVFGALVSRIGFLKLDSLKKGILLGMLYIEIASQPILITAPLLITMTTPDIVQWYALSTIMHLIYGIVLGGILSYEQKKTASANTPVTQSH